MITFDIETIPTNNIDVIAKLGKSIRPPGNIKKPESIKEWMDLNYQSLLDELVKKTSFDGAYGRIACIAWSDGQYATESTLSNDDEAEAINKFYDFLHFAEAGQTFCGHNLTVFDLPFLKHRSIVLGIKPPKCLLNAMNAKPWDPCIADTMLMWSQDRDKRISMDNLCSILGIEGKGDFDGSMVADEWKNGDRNKVIDYCKEDVERTIKIYNRLTFAA